MAKIRLAGLLQAGARVTLVAPEIQPELVVAGVSIFQRPFEAKDLDGIWLAVAASTAEVNRRVAAEAEARRIFVNAVDDPQCGSAYMGALVRRGDVTVAISTGGKAPALAGLLREGLEAVIPEEVNDWAETARTLRPKWKTAGVPLNARRPLLLEALNRLYAPLTSEGWT
jgi:uroporphyrin-III C-methyltransferase / precorrin-2 dehydrogenase / sirohydrochlorin ferrochelatase